LQPFKFAEQCPGVRDAKPHGFTINREAARHPIIPFTETVRFHRTKAFSDARRKAGPDSSASPQITTRPRRGTRFTNRRNANW